MVGYLIFLQGKGCLCFRMLYVAFSKDTPFRKHDYEPVLEPTG
ncbi:conserved hypothetical protein [Roseibium sp. TrichSKD4]|nr:conserved hypothetical protein [Roseibium sp. TrichSKD4]